MPPSGPEGTSLLVGADGERPLQEVQRERRVIIAVVQTLLSDESNCISSQKDLAEELGVEEEILSEVMSGRLRHGGTARLGQLVEEIKVKLLKAGFSVEDEVPSHGEMSR